VKVVHTSKINVTPSVIELARAFNESGEALYVIGGAVRDSLWNKDHQGFDLITTALPNQANFLLSEAGWNVSKETLACVCAQKAGVEHEIRSCHISQKWNNDDCVMYSTLECDVLNRDFTINALCYDPIKLEILDFTTGLKDIEDKKLVSIKDPVVCFQDSNVRIIRALRFLPHCKFDSRIDATLRNVTLRSNLGLVGDWSKEIKREFLRGLDVADSVNDYLDGFDSYDLWREVFVGLDVVGWKLSSKRHSVVLATLLCLNDVAKVSKSLFDMNFSAQEVNDITFLLDFRKIKLSDTPKMWERYLRTKLTSEDLLEFAVEIGDDSFINNVKVFLGKVAVPRVR